MDSICDAVLAVLADEELRLERIISRDNIEKSAALTRISAGKNEQYYKEKTPHIIYNNGEKEELYKHFENVLNTIIGG